jgi:hypothetical protein
VVGAEEGGEDYTFGEGLVFYLKGERRGGKASGRTREELDDGKVGVARDGESGRERVKVKAQVEKPKRWTGGVEGEVGVRREQIRADGTRADSGEWIVHSGRWIVGNAKCVVDRMRRDGKHETKNHTPI